MGSESVVIRDRIAQLKHQRDQLSAALLAEEKVRKEIEDRCNTGEADLAAAQRTIATLREDAARVQGRLKTADVLLHEACEILTSAEWHFESHSIAAPKFARDLALFRKDHDAFLASAVAAGVGVDLLAELKRGLAKNHQFEAGEDDGTCKWVNPKTGTRCGIAGAYHVFLASGSSTRETPKHSCGRAGAAYSHTPTTGFYLCLHCRISFRVEPAAPEPAPAPATEPRGEPLPSWCSNPNHSHAPHANNGECDPAPASAQCPPHIPRDGRCRWCGEEVPASVQGTTGLIRELAVVLNRASAENGSDTPDFILATFLSDALAAFDKAVSARHRWFGPANPPQPALVGPESDEACVCEFPRTECPDCGNRLCPACKKAAQPAPVERHGFKPGYNPKRNKLCSVLGCGQPRSAAVHGEGG